MKDGLSSSLLLGDCVIVVNKDGSAVCGVAVGMLLDGECVLSPLSNDGEGLSVGLYITVG